MDMEHTPKGDQIRIYNHQGILVHQEQIISESKTLDISANDLVQGLYIIELIGQTYNYKTTFIKQ